MGYCRLDRATGKAAFGARRVAGRPLRLQIRTLPDRPGRLTYYAPRTTFTR